MAKSSKANFRAIVVQDVVLNLDARLRFDVVFIHREVRGHRGNGRKAKGPITDVSVVGLNEIHLYEADALDFLRWLRRLGIDAPIE